MGDCELVHYLKSKIILPFCNFPVLYSSFKVVKNTSIEFWTSSLSATKNKKGCDFRSHLYSGKSMENRKARKNQLSANDRSKGHQM